MLHGAGRELQPEGHALHRSAYPDQVLGRPFVEPDPLVDAMESLHEHADRVVSLQPRTGPEGVRQPAHTGDVLCADPEGLAAGHHADDVRAVLDQALEELLDAVLPTDEVLGVVDDDQHLAFLQPRQQRCERVCGRPDPVQAQRGGHGQRDLADALQAGQLDQHRPLLEQPCAPVSDLEAQPALAHPTRPDERQQPMSALADRRREPLHLLDATVEHR